MLQLISLNKDIKEKYLGTRKRYFYCYEDSSLVLKEKDICELTTIGSTHLFTVDPDMNNNAVYFFNGAEGIAVSAVSTAVTITNHADMIHNLEAEVLRLREEVSRLRNSSDETTERTDSHA